MQRCTSLRILIVKLARTLKRAVLQICVFSQNRRLWMHSPHIILFLDLFFLLAIIYFLSFPFVAYIFFIFFYIVFVPIISSAEWRTMPLFSRHICAFRRVHVCLQFPDPCWGQNTPQLILYISCRNNCLNYRVYLYQELPSNADVHRQLLHAPKTAGSTVARKTVADLQQYCSMNSDN